MQALVSACLGALDSLFISLTKLLGKHDLFFKDGYGDVKLSDAWRNYYRGVPQVSWHLLVTAAAVALRAHLQCDGAKCTLVAHSARTAS